MKKILTKKDKVQNVIVEVIFWYKGDLVNKRQKYKCAGVLMNELNENLRVGFSAVDGILQDYLDIPKTDVVKIRRVSKDKYTKSSSVYFK